MSEQEHNIDGAVYALGNDGEYRPAILCSCGFTSREWTWEEAGEGYDFHLSQVEKERGGEAGR